MPSVVIFSSLHTRKIPRDPPADHRGSIQAVYLLSCNFQLFGIVVNVLSLYKTPNKNMSVCLSVFQYVGNMKKCIVNLHRVPQLLRIVASAAQNGECERFAGFCFDCYHTVQLQQHNSQAFNGVGGQGPIIIVFCLEKKSYKR